MAKKGAVKQEPEKRGRGRPATPVSLRDLEAQLAKLEAAKSPDADEIEKAKRKIRRVKRNQAKAAGTFVPRGGGGKKAAAGKKASKKAVKGPRKPVAVVAVDEDEDDEDED